MSIDSIDQTFAKGIWIPEVWANSALAILRNYTVVAPRVYSDSDVAAFTVGDTLHIPYPGTLATHSKAAQTAYTLSVPSGTSDVQVTLSNHEAVSFIVEDIVRAQANQDLLKNYTNAAAIALATKIESDLIDEIAGSSKEYGAYGADLDFAKVNGAWKAMTDNLCPQGDRFLAVSTKDQIALLADSKLAAWAAFSRGNAAVGSPMDLGPVAGFDGVLASQLITTAAGTPAQTENIAWRRDGVMLAMRGMPEPPVGTGAVAANVRDDQSGLVLRSVIAYDAAYGGVRVTLEALYGVKRLQDEKTLVVKA